MAGAAIVKVVVAGEDEEACWLLRLVLEQETDLVVVGHSIDGKALIPLLLDLLPDVVLIDLDAHGEGIVSAIEVAKLHSLPTRFLGLTGGPIGKESLGAELDGILYKNQPLTELAAAVHSIAADAVPRGTTALLDAESAEREHMLNLYLTETERNQRELEERLRMVQFWLQDGSTAQRDLGEHENLLSLYIADTERNQRDMEERLAMVQLWLQDNAGVTSATAPATALPLAVAGTPDAGPPVAVPARLSRGDQGLPRYALSVDGFFNAQHKITVGGAGGVLHSHSWRVSIRLRQRTHGDQHTLIGFAEAKQLLRGEISWFDNKVLNNLPQFAELPPTTENVASVLFKNLRASVRDLPVSLESLTVWESPTNAVTCSEDDV